MTPKAFVTVDPALRAFLRKTAAQTPELVGANGERLWLPKAMYDVLRQVAEALSSGIGVTVAPMNPRLTTQEADDFLGISRPTLDRMAREGEADGLHEATDGPPRRTR